MASAGLAGNFRIWGFQPGHPQARYAPPGGRPQLHPQRGPPFFLRSGISAVMMVPLLGCPLISTSPPERALFL